jgi:predicted negative regulator of RcsB-dependent stress response
MRARRSITLALTLLLWQGLPCEAAQLQAPGDQEPAQQVLDPAIAGSLRDELLDVSAMSSEALFTRTIAAHGKIDLLLAELEQLLEAEGIDEDAVLHLQGLLLQRRGDLADSLLIYDELCDLGGREEDWLPSTEHLLQRARLLDALGRVDESVESWEALLKRTEDEALKDMILFRLALLRMESDDEHTDALAQFAGEEGRDAELRNRAAVVLGLIDHPEDAIELYVIDETHEKRFRQEIRVAEWALAAENSTVAQEHAWKAVFNARLTRDRHYGLTILIEAHRQDDSLDALIDRFAAEEELDKVTHKAWIALLRERERFDEAIELFRSSSGIDIESRRQLLEMYREAGNEEVMYEVYRDLIAEEPLVVEWRDGLSRAYLERGDRHAAEEVWRSLIDDPGSIDVRVQAANRLMELGLDELASECAESCIAEGVQTYAALIFLFELYKDRGQLDLAEAALIRMHERAPPGAAERFQLADAWEQLDRQEEAIRVLEGLREARAEDSGGEDLEMRLAWLYSEIGEEEIALERWLDLWKRIKSIARRRYAEDRLMTVASRLGSLADIAIGLEQKLLERRANDREAGLLVRLYTKVGDPVSAAEIIDEFLEQSGGSVVDSLQEKARVYISCNDYFNYEEVVRELIKVDPEAEGDYLRQLAMSQLERGKPDEAREVLEHLKELEMGTESVEFEAGVLALAGLREEAIEAYHRGLAANPGRIESFLLMANLMRDIGQTERAVGMFQYLAETAERDDLFTIAIDGLLNLEAPRPVLQWARRITLERLAGRHDKMYLYQLLSDLAEQVDDQEGMLLALENSLPISGERRPSVLRELMDISRGTSRSPFSISSSEGKPEKHLAYGRRLIGLAEVVPPQVYLDLGEAFLKQDDAANARKTFALASDLPDYPNFQRQAAGLFDSAGFRETALSVYKRVLVARSSDVGLMLKVGELEEHAGRDQVAAELYTRALELLFTRQPLSTLDEKEESRQTSFFDFYGARNIDDFDKHYERLLKNLLIVRSEDDTLESLMDAQVAAIDSDIDQLLADRSLADQAPGKGQDERHVTLGQHPRIRSRASFYRRLAIAYDRPELADALDLRLLEAFPEDKGLLEELCQARVSWSLYGSIRTLLDHAPNPQKERDKLRFLVGEGLDERSARRLPLSQTVGLFLPMLVGGRNEETGTLIRRTDFAQVAKEELGSIEPLFSAGIYMADPDLTLLVAREWIRLYVKYRVNLYMVRPVLQRCRGALEEESYRNLCLSFTDQVLENPEELSSYLPLFPELQKEFEETLISEDQVLELLDDYADSGWGFGISPVISLLPPESQGGALRTVWSKLKPSTRPHFLISLVSDSEEELGDAVSSFIEQNFPESLSEVDEIPYYRISEIGESVENHSLCLSMLDLLIDRQPTSWTAKAGRAAQLKALGRTDEALEQALEVFVGLLDNDLSEYQDRRARDSSIDPFLPERIDAFVAALQEVIDERGNSPELAGKHIDLLSKASNSDAMRELLVKASEEFPENKELLTKRISLARREERRIDEISLLQRLAELDEDSLSKLHRTWVRLVHPVNTLAIKERLMEKESEDSAKAEPLQGLTSLKGLSPIRPVVSTKPDSGRQAKDDRPTVQKIKEAIAVEDLELARMTFRRIWRKFPKGEQGSSRSMILMLRYGQNLPTLGWPEDKTDGADEQEEEVDRGGLDDWSDEEPEKAQLARSAYEVLAQYPFGADELRRLIRSKLPHELDSLRIMFRGLLAARIEEEGTEGTLEALLDSVSSGSAGKAKTTMLLTMLDEYPELGSPGTHAVLGEIARSLRPTDVGPIRSLARVSARQGRAEEASRLYRWCATRTSTAGFDYFGTGPTVSAYALVKEAKEQLDGEELLEVIDSIIQFADPGDYYWAREGFELLILETFMELMEPAEALERCSEILENSTDFSKGLRRRTALRSAVLLAQNNKLEEAIRNLEYGICSLSDEVITSKYMRWSRPSLPGNWSSADFRRLFPLDHSEFKDPLAWYLAVADALELWLDEERIKTSQATKAMVLLSLRLNGLGETERAHGILQGLAERSDVNNSLKLWVADAARQLGDGELANQIERRQFSEGSLHLERIHELISREMETQGPEAALLLGEQAIEYTLHEKLLEVLVMIAQTTGDEQVIERWQGLSATAEAARARLEEIAEEEKRQAEREAEAAKK